MPADDDRLTTRADLDLMARAASDEIYALARRLRVTVGRLLLAHGAALVAALALAGAGQG